MASKYQAAADYCGMTVQELKAALSDPKTCPLCSETGEVDQHSPRSCGMVLDVWADRAADARNSAF